MPLWYFELNTARFFVEGLGGALGPIVAKECESVESKTVPKMGSLRKETNRINCRCLRLASASLKLIMVTFCIAIFFDDRIMRTVNRNAFNKSL